MNVFETTLPGIAASGFVQREKRLPAFARRAGAWIEQQIRFSREPKQHRAKNLFVCTVAIRENNFRKKEWVA